MLVLEEGRAALTARAEAPIFAAESTCGARACAVLRLAAYGKGVWVCIDVSF